MMASVAGDISYSIQWVKVPFGASGSSTINSRLWASAGISEKVSGGLILSPSQVYCGKNWPFGCRALLVIVIRVPPLIAFDVGGAAEPYYWHFAAGVQ